MSRNALVSLSLLVGCATAPGGAPEAVPVEPQAIPESYAFAAPAAPPAALPAGKAIVRSCYDDGEDEEARGPSGGLTKSKAATGSSAGYGSGTASPSAPPPASVAPPTKQAATPFRAVADKPGDDGAIAELPDTRDRGTAPDWGGTTWLSNDDSMSLASAQRTLWALQHGQTPSPSEIRPHELLNYFSFDTVAPEGTAVFGIGSVAEKIDADTLSAAFVVKGATPERRPLDLTLVVDRSGSMSAEGRMAYVKSGLQLMTGQLHTGDRVDLVLFDDSVCTPLQDFVVGRDDPALLTDAIAAMQPRNGTNIGIGLKEAYQIATARESSIHRNQRVMLLTDALVNQGIVDADTLSEVGRGFDEHDIRLSGVGVGTQFDDRVLDKLTEKGKGAYVYLGSEAVTKRVFGSGFDSLVETVAHDVRFELDLPPSLAMERFYGEEASTEAEDIQPINYSAGTAQLFLEDLTVDPSKASPDDPIKLTVHYRDARTDEPVTQVYTTTLGAMLKGDRHNVDKARALMAFADVVTTSSMGGSPCEGAATWSERASRVSDDQEVAFVHGLVRGVCATTPDLTAPPVNVTSTVASVAYKVKVDSDVPIAEAALACAGAESTDALSASDTIARFSARPGACTLTLQGAVPLVANVTVPDVGGETRCMVRGGRVSCS